VTYLEKAKEIYPSLSENIIVYGYCPIAFDLGRVKCEKTCCDCWNREMPEKEG
jgi:hypothetical protein